MTKAFLTLLVAILSTAVFAHTPVHGGEVNVSESKVIWEGKKVTGTHQGTIAIKEGHLDLEGHKLVGGHIVMDMTSMVCTDLTGPGAKKLVGHLSSDDFFGVEAHPTAEMKITEVSMGDMAGKFNVTADVTIKGITESTTFEAIMGDHAATAKIKIDRTKFGIKYGSGSFFDNLGDKAIDNEFTLLVNLALK